MIKFKSLAIALEKRLEERKRSNGLKSLEDNQNNVECSTSFDTNLERISLEPINTNGINDKTIDSNEATIVETSLSNSIKLSEISALHLETISVSHYSDYRSDALSPSFSLHLSPSMGALNDSKNQTLYLTPYSVRDSPDAEFTARKLIRSNSYTIETPSPLLIKHMEANGINLEKDKISPAIVVNAGSQLSINRDQSIKMESKDAVKKSPPINNQASKNISIKSYRKTPSPARNCALLSSRSSGRNHQLNKDNKQKNSVPKKKSTQNGAFKNNEALLRSIYDGNLTARSNSSAKNLNPIGTSPNKSKAKQISPGTISKESNVQISNVNDYENILKMIEDQHNTQMDALLQRQKDEQHRMQEEFARQQESLMKQISNMVLKQGCSEPMNQSHSFSTQVPFSSEKNSSNDTSTSISSQDFNGNHITQYPEEEKLVREQRKLTPDNTKCIRRLVYYDDNQMVTSDLNESNLSLGEQTESIRSFNLKRNDMPKAQFRAAMIITAYAKGYLTRRLFKTVRVQNIVKTIRDTLLFILDIHYESSENESPADLKLKTHLIQQVCHFHISLHTYRNELNFLHNFYCLL